MKAGVNAKKFQEKLEIYSNTSPPAPPPVGSTPAKPPRALSDGPRPVLAPFLIAPGPTVLPHAALPWRSPSEAPRGLGV